MKLLKRSGICAALLALTACSSEQTQSEFISTEGLWTDMKIESDGSQSRVVVELNVAGPNGVNVNLSGDDRLVVRAAGQSKTLLRDTDFLDIDYQEYIDVTTDDTQFVISLIRTDKENAENSRVSLPKNFDIHAPLSSDRYTLNDSVSIDWDGLGDNTIQLTLSSECENVAGGSIFQSHSVDTADDGQYDVTLNDLEMFNNAEVDMNKDCKFAVHLRRESSGQVDSVFVNGSKIIAAQHRKVSDIVIDN